MTETVSIYADEGAGAWGLAGLRPFFGNERTRLVSADDVIGGSAFENCRLFVMPGGADIPYARKLNGAGNRAIRAFVENGGAYLGICAGAYYGCAAIRFRGEGDMTIAGPRELAFLGGVAEGPLPALAPPYDETLCSAAVARLLLADGSRAGFFYFGGPSFIYEDDPDIRVHARYADVPGAPPAIVEIPVGRGRAILSGIHPEASAAHVRTWIARDAPERERAHALADELEAEDPAARAIFLRKLKSS